jgi:hypothetical protein
MTQIDEVAVKLGEELKAIQFESTTCSRCCGSGNYSYCQRYGTTCFKCGGAKKVFTKRGAAANAMYQRSLEVPATEVRVGDWIMSGGVTNDGQVYGRWEKVIEINPSTQRSTLTVDGVTTEQVYFADIVSQRGEWRCSHTCFATSMFRKKWPIEQCLAKKRAALAFQETLTKAGTPRKR